MADRTRGMVCRLRAAARRSLRVPTPTLLLLALLAWPTLATLRAQPGPAPDRAVPPAPVQPPGVPVPTGQPTPPLPSGPVPTRPEVAPPPAPPAQPPRRVFAVAPNTPLKELLPPAPRVERVRGPLQGDDLSRVPEVRFRKPSAALRAEAFNGIADQIAKINHLNGKKTDGFIEALCGERADLSGLPFAMGDACRTKGERSRQFTLAVATVRRALQLSSGPVPPVAPASPPTAAGVAPVSTRGASDRPARATFHVAAFAFQASDTPPAPVTPPAPPSNPPSPDSFWEQYQTLCTLEDRAQGQSRGEQRDLFLRARIAALTQILLPMAEMHPGLVKFLASVSHVEATRALARLAIFSGDEQVRRAALDALKVRRESDYTAILVGGLRYPWPTVARRAAEAIVALERSDLLPKLVELLEEDDPRAPVAKSVQGKRVPVVRELVRVNHHRSCLLCHAPGNTGKVSGDAVTAEVPVPGEPLQPPTNGYAPVTRTEILVRIDVTYLRQDFSAMQAVADAAPWPEMQRFDFLVRTRVLTDDEAAEYREQLKPKEEGRLSPYRRAALAALRELTGRDTAPTAEAWKRLLKLP